TCSNAARQPASVAGRGGGCASCSGLITEIFVAIGVGSGRKAAPPSLEVRVMDEFVRERIAQRFRLQRQRLVHHGGERSRRPATRGREENIRPFGKVA